MLSIRCLGQCGVSHRCAFGGKSSRGHFGRIGTGGPGPPLTIDVVLGGHPMAKSTIAPYGEAEHREAIARGCAAPLFR